MHNLGRPINYSAPAFGSGTCGNVSTTGTITSGTYVVNEYGGEEIVDYIEYPDKLVVTFVDYKIFSTFNSTNTELKRVYKIIYSCVDGKWNKSQPIFGQIIEHTEEEYIFKD